MNVIAERLRGYRAESQRQADAARKLAALQLARQSLNGEAGDALPPLDAAVEAARARLDT